jgi:hypothetical protein
MNEGVFVVDKMIGDHRGWLRVITYHFNGEEYPYALEAIGARSEEEAQVKLYGTRPAEATRELFLKQVFLDTRRPH